MKAREAATALMDWFARHGRALPWRARHDPYEVLVAEFILQQTRMETGVPRFESFLRRFPTVLDLARARESTVLAEWSGLGYYARARNLHRTAKEIVSRFAGRVPDDAAVLRELPGIGPYTAGAVASIAYDRPDPSLDGNQFRVLGRFLGASAVADRTAIETWSRALLAQGSPRILNQAIMDLGSSICTPADPSCSACPLLKGCATRGAGHRSVVRSPKVPVQNWTASRFVRKGRVWLTAPRGEGLLGAHWLPPLREGKRRRVPDLTHSFSHRRWNLWWEDAVGTPRGAGRWVALEDLERLPHGPVTRRFVEAAVAANCVAAPPRRRAPSAAHGAPSATRA